MQRYFEVICRKEIENKIKENIDKTFNVSGYICYSISRAKRYSIFNFYLGDIFMDFENPGDLDSMTSEFYTKFFGDIFPEEVFVVNNSTEYYNSYGDEDGHDEVSIYQGRNLKFFCESIRFFDLTEKETENITAGKEY